MDVRSRAITEQICGNAFGNVHGLVRNRLLLSNVPRICSILACQQQRTDLLQLYEGAAGWVPLSAASVSTVPFSQRKEEESLVRGGGPPPLSESWHKYHFHTRNLLMNWPAREHFVLQQKQISDETSRRSLQTQRCLVCATGPALCGHNNGQNNYWKSNVVNRKEDG